MAASREETWKTFGKLVAALVAAGVLVAGLALPYVGGLGLVAGREADKFQNTTCDLPESKPPQRTTLYARDGKTVLATLFSQNRVEIGLDQIPKTLQEALIATEDRRFYSHHGVDMRGLIRSAVSTSSGDTQGGSTLTMQYVKQVRYYEAGDDQKKQQAAIVQNIDRKIEDAKCAIYIEETLKQSKQQILQNYLNIAFFGENSYGIQTAAKTYFNKNASQLQPQESALLVGMLRAPSAYDPFINRVAAKERRDEVLQNMVAVKKFTQAEADKYKALPIQLASDGPPPVRQGCANSETTIRNSGFFCDYVVNWLQSVTKLTEQQLQTGGYKVITTIDPKLQNTVQASIEKSVPASAPSTALLPVVQPRTGDVLAMASSKQYGLKTGQTVQPMFTKAVAQPASTFKLFPLLAALEYGMPADWTLQTVGGDGAKYKSKNCITPSNVENGDENVSYNVNESLRSAMVKSSNSFFVGASELFFGCRLNEMVSIAQRLGLNSLDAKENSRETIAQYIVSKEQVQRFTLGNPAASPLEMAGAYAGVANEGDFNAPAPVTMVYDSDGNAVDTRRGAAVQAVPAETAMKAVDIMTGETKGQGTSADRFRSWYADDGSDIAGKTGTAPGTPTSKNGAIWFVGMTPSIAAATAIINIDNPSATQAGLPGVKNGTAYGDYAAKVWLSALRSTLDRDKWTWTQPDEVEGKDVPNVIGDSVSAAKSELTDAGFKVHVAGTENGGNPVLCPSSVALNDVAYYGPKRAPEGTTITICQSLADPQPIFSPPPPTRSRTRDSGNNNDGGNTRGSGNTRGGGGGGNSGGSSAPGGGGAGGPGGGGAGGGRGGR